MRLDQWLKRQRPPMSESEAARRLGVAQSALNRITNERLPPTLKNAAKIVRATNEQVGYEDLLGPSVRRNLWRYDGRLAPPSPA